jgi:hypothetical protein
LDGHNLVTFLKAAILPREIASKVFYDMKKWLNVFIKNSLVRPDPDLIDKVRNADFCYSFISIVMGFFPENKILIPFLSLFLYVR